MFIHVDNIIIFKNQKQENDWNNSDFSWYSLNGVR